MKIASVTDYRARAKRRLPHFLFEYIDGGSYDQITLDRNRRDLQTIALRQRVLCDISAVTLETQWFGETVAMPIGLGPVGLAGITARRGEVQAARAAAGFQVPFCLSTMSGCSLEEIAAAKTGPFWFQLYMIKDRGFMRDVLQRAQAAGCTTLLFTVDLPVPGSRYRDIRSHLTGADTWQGATHRFLQAALRPAWAWDVAIRGRPLGLGNIAPVLDGKTGLEDFLGWSARNFDASCTWEILDFIREHWTGKLVIKGILDPEDALSAVQAGVDGIVVSNHGGRQLDGALSSTAALPAIVEAVAGRVTVLADSGVRSGLDVVRLMALGADGVLLGRAWVFALAAAGEAGVRHVLELMAAEMRVAMALTGTASIAAIDRSILAEHPGR